VNGERAAEGVEAVGEAAQPGTFGGGGGAADAVVGDLGGDDAAGERATQRACWSCRGARRRPMVGADRVPRSRWSGSCTVRSPLPTATGSKR
jgi:hypothetical protein